MSENINSEVIPVDWEELDKESSLNKILEDVSEVNVSSAFPGVATLPGGSIPGIPPWLANLGASAAGAAEYGARTAVPAAARAAASSPLSLLAMLFDPFSVAASSQGYDPSALHQRLPIDPTTGKTDLSFYKPTGWTDPTGITHWPGGTTVPGDAVQRPLFPDYPGVDNEPVAPGKELEAWKPTFGEHDVPGEDISYDPRKLTAKERGVDPKLVGKGDPPPPMKNQPKKPGDKKDWKKKLKEGIRKTLQTPGSPKGGTVAKTLNFMKNQLLINEAQDLWGLPDVTPFDLVMGAGGTALDAMLLGNPWDRTWEEKTPGSAFLAATGYDPILGWGKEGIQATGDLTNIGQNIAPIVENIFESEHQIAVPESTKAPEPAMPDWAEELFARYPRLEKKYKDDPSKVLKFQGKEFSFGKQGKYKGGYVKGYQEGGFVKNEYPGTFPIYPEDEIGGELGTGGINPYEDSPWQPDYEPGTTGVNPPNPSPDWQQYKSPSMPFNPPGGDTIYPSPPGGGWGELTPNYNPAYPATPVTGEGNYLNPPGAQTAMDWTPGEGPTGYQEIDPFAPTGGGVNPIIPDDPWFNPDWWVNPPEEEEFPVVDPVYSGKSWGGAGGGYVPLNGFFRK